MARGFLNVPPGIELLHAVKGRKFSYAWYKGSVLVLTFLCYMAFHASRKPPSIVKSVLNGEKNTTIISIHRRSLLDDSNQEIVDAGPATPLSPSPGGWFPFNGANGQSLLGEVDFAFLGAYAIGMFFAGHLGDRVDLRHFLATGMIGSGIFVSLFGMAFFWDVHYLSYFVFVQIFAGLFQSTGWPSVVSIMANWFGKGKRGLIMGIWNAHTSVGNILGTVIAAACVSKGWGWSFIYPGLLIIVLGFLILGFLVVQPSDVGLASPYGSGQPEEEKEEMSEKRTNHHESESIHFLDAWKIPGVASFALCLFFSKLIAYVFLYWLPYYIKKTPIENRMLTPKEAGDLSILFDVGGVMGGILAGHLSDKSGASALVSVGFTLCSVPVLYLYRVYGHVSFGFNIALMMMSGFFVNGPYALITTAVSADLGTHESLNGNSKALATVTAIIDGMGSIGAAIGPALTGYISDNGGFDMVFAMLYLSAFVAAALLFGLAKKEWRVLQESKKNYVRSVSMGNVTYQPVINVKI